MRHRASIKIGQIVILDHRVARRPERQQQQRRREPVRSFPLVQ